MAGGIRARITALASIIVLLVLASAAWALLRSQRMVLLDALDESLTAEAEKLIDMSSSADLESPLPATGDDDSVTQIAMIDGTVVAASENYAGGVALPAPSGGAIKQFRTAELLAGEPEYRVLSVRVDDRIVHVATPLDDIDESVAALRLGLSAAIPVTSVVLAALVWWLVDRTLRPVEAIRREVADISGKNLHRRVPETRIDDEIDRLARTMNEMLDRLERSAESQRRFIADASHELRSPLTRIRAELEVDRDNPGSADLIATHLSVLEETVQMQRLVEDLLVLARHDADASVSTDAVDLDDIVLRELQHASERTAATIDAGGVSAAQVHGDARQLERLVRNLLENAVRHTRARIEVTLSARDGVATLEVHDDGPGIPLADQSRVFERFTRLDDARAREDGGTGLGLAIARAIAERHNGSIRIDPDATSGTRLVVELPLTEMDHREQGF